MSDPIVQRPGLLVVVSSPSGAGKTTLCHRLMGEFPSLIFSVSYTTRTIRRGEEEGIDYCFVDEALFDEMVARDQFAEWAEVHGHRYGTTVAAVRQALEGAKDVLFDIDYQGGRQLKAKFKNEAVLVFVLPPSLRELEARLRNRATDDPEVIARRLRKAHDELKQYGLYDYLVVNDDLAKAYDRLRGIYLAAQCEIERTGHIAETLVKEAEAEDRSEGLT
ncbi:MAG: guanylate kinase [Myxococcales bacterium]|nr:guanylate kinase [Myxococcales bacterium]